MTYDDHMAPMTSLKTKSFFENIAFQGRRQLREIGRGKIKIRGAKVFAEMRRPKSQIFRPKGLRRKKKGQKKKKRKKKGLRRNPKAFPGRNRKF